MLDSYRSLGGVLLILALATLLSTDRRAIRWRTVGAGVLLQFAFGLFVLKTDTGTWVFRQLGDAVNALIGFSNAGARFLFGPLADPAGGVGFVFAFQILPTVIFMGALMGVLYHAGIMQRAVRGMAWVMRRLMGVSGAESLAAAANVFVGQTEAPLVVGPYLQSMTRSELMALMTGGFATVAGGVLAVYASMGIDPAHLLAASVMSAPAALVLAKVLVPETETPLTAGLGVHDEPPRTTVNLIDAAAAGTTDGLKLALNVGAMLIGFIALMFLADAALGWLGEATGLVSLIRRYDPSFERLTLSVVFGVAFQPVALAIGVPWADAARYGDLIGTQVILTELVAYQKLAGWLPGAFDEGGFSPRAAMIATYGLCAFANVGSIGIQLGGIGALVEGRRHDLARLALRAMLAGLLAANMTAAIAGALVSEGEADLRHAQAMAAREGTSVDPDGAFGDAFLRRVAERHPGTRWAQEAAREARARAARREAGEAPSAATPSLPAAEREAPPRPPPPPPE